MFKDLKKTIEEIAVRKILRKHPEASAYKSMIKFNHSENKVSMDLDLLPPELARQIDEMFK